VVDSADRVDLVDQVVEDPVVAVAEVVEVVVAAVVLEDSIRPSRTGRCFIKEEMERWTRRIFR
jgi:hypothetical protein